MAGFYKRLTFQKRNLFITKKYQIIFPRDEQKCNFD